MKQKKGMRAIAFVLAFCLVFHSGAIYAAEGAAKTEPETIAETQTGITTPDQNDSTLNELAETETQDQTQLDASEATETQEETQSDIPAETETQDQTQPDTPAVTETQEETQSDTPAVTEAQGQTRSDAPAGNEKQEQTQSDTPAGTEAQGQTQSDTPAGTETQEQTQSGTPATTETQDQRQSDTPAGNETQEQTQSDTPSGTKTQGKTAEDSTATDTTDTDAETSDAAETDSIQPETPAAGETLPEGTNGSDENTSGTAGTETDGTTVEGTTTGESTEAGETASEQETTAGETLPATEPLSENGETESGTESESETDDIAMIMGLDEIAPIALDDGSVAKIEGGQSYETLRQAIEAVQENETITLLGDTFGNFTSNGKNFTLDLNTYKLSASGGTALTVTDGEVTVQNGTIDGGGSARALELNGGCTFTGKGLTVCNGQVSGNGGGISATGSCTVNLTDCHILSNTVDGNNNKGGGIYMQGGTLTISGTEIAANIAYEGAGLYLDSTSIQGEGLNIHENTSNGQGGRGGVYLNSVSGSIRDSKVHENTMAHGSGIYISGGSLELDKVEIYNNAVYNQVSGSGVALYCIGKAKLTYKNGQIHDNNGEGEDAIIYAQDEDTEVQFKNVDIYGNTGALNTAWFKNYAKAVFEECSIYGNTASMVGGVKVTGFNTLASFENTVIKNNTANNTVNNIKESPIGGLYVGTRAGVEFKSNIAIYGNITEAQNSENDILIESNKPAIDLPAASSMRAEGKSFDHYVWKEGNEKYSDLIEIPANNDKVRSFTAIEDKPRYVAQIGETKYEKLEDAVEQAAEGNTIVLIAGNDPEDPYGKSLVSDQITISKSVTIHFSGQDISCTEESVGEPLFEVTGDGSLTLTGNGNISGEVESQGTLTLEGKVSAEKYIHNGKTFILNGAVGDITVELAKEKYLTATDKCEADSIKLIFDSEFVSDFNDETKDPADDRLLVMHDGNFDESKLVLQEIKPLISDLLNNEKEVKLHKSLLKGVFVGGIGAVDSNPGTTTDQPVATLKEAVEKLNASSELDTIWVLGEVDVSEPTEVDFAGSGEKKMIRRHPSYDGVLFQVKSSLELSNVIVDGMRTYMETPTDTLFEGGAGSSIFINSGAELCNNNLNKEETDGLTEADKKKGGAIRSFGTVVLDGGKIYNCNAYMGGGIYIHDGLFQMKSGTITDCTATGHMSYEGKSQVAAGGGICVEGVGKMTMEGGTIENCSAGIGGGISLGGSYVLYPNAKDVETFVMNGGTIQNCIARTNGGGLYVQGSYKATIGEPGGSNYIYIQKNESQSGNFGGGGIYVNSGGIYENGRLQLYNAVIRNNIAGSPGGGLAGCNTSRTKIYLNDGGVFYQNTGLGKKDDILLSDSSGDSMATSAPYSFVSEYMLGGDPYFWKHVGSDEDYGVNYLHDDDLVKHMYTNAADGSESIDNALALATVFIQDNSSVVRGGGIGSNGDVILGTDDPDTTEISVAKEWDDAGYDERRPDKVYVWLFRDGEKVSCVEIEKAADGTWPAVSFTKLATGHEYMISEETTGMPAIYTSEVVPAEANQPTYTVKNHINCGRLCIHKAVEGAPDASGTFRFKVYLEKDGAALTGTYPVRSSDGTESTAEFTDGIAEVEVADGGYLFIDDIPQGASATVTELTTEGYVVYAGDIENPDEMVSECSGNIESKLTEDLYFRNVYSHDNQLTLTKQTVTGTDTQYPVSRTFWFALYDDSGYTHRVSDIKAMSFDDASSASITFDGLLNNKTYYIAELDSEGNVINEGTHYLADGSSFTVSGGSSHLIGQGAENTESIKNTIIPKTVKSYLDIPVTKTLTGRNADSTKDTYIFTLAGTDGAPMPADTSAILTLPEAASSTFADMFGEIPFTEAGTYTYEIREQVGITGGITYDNTVYRITIQVESFDTIDNETVLVPNLTAIESSTDGNTFKDVTNGINGTAAFSNTYKAASVDYAPVVEKTVTGDVPADNQKNFTFVMSPADTYDSVSMPDDLTCTVTGNGKGTFDAITFTEPGTYVFMIREQSGKDAGYTYDNAVYTLTLVVEDKLDGNLAITSKTYRAGDVSGDTAAFTNVYTTTPTAFAPSVTKTVTGSKTPEDKTFSFQLSCQSGDEDGYEITDSTVSVTGSGKAVFKDIQFTKAGTYVFTITENDGDEPGYTYDQSVHTLTVVVGDHDSILKVDSAVYKKDGAEENSAVFTNTYGVTGTELSIPVEKKLTGSETPDDKDFLFKLTGESKTGYEISDDSLKLTGAGEGAFEPIIFTKAGTFTFNVSETKGSDKGYVYDDTVYTATITVTDHDSQLRIDSVVYEADGEKTDAVVFTNHYTTTPADFNLEITKKIVGEETPADQTFDFNIELKDKNQEGVILKNTTVSVTGSGKTALGGIAFSKAGTYTFQVSEVQKSIPGYSFDGNNFDVEVVVTDEESQLTVSSVTYKKNSEPEDGITFTNTYSTTSVSYAPQIRKVITGDIPSVNKDFHFELTNKNSDGVTMPASNRVTISGAGRANFEPITFSKAGTYSFEISETAGSDKGYVYDDTVYKVMITVGDHDSLLQVDSVVYEADGEEADAAVFTNRYEETYAVYQPQVRKVITGAEPQAEQKFDFTLTAKDTDGLVMPESTTATVSGQGTATFGAVTFTKAGTYSFEIREVDGGLPGYTYSDDVWTLTVQVTDEDSALTLHEITYQAGEEQRTDAAEFVNVHRTGSLVVKKELVFEGHLLHALDQQFYVALYSDAECTNRVSDVKKLIFEDETSEEVVFDGLDIGAAYYIGECKEDGTAISSGYLADGTYFQAVFADGNEVLLEGDKEQVQKNFSNEFLHIPQNYYYQGELTVEKRLQDAEGNPKTSDDIFYIGVFEDEAHTKLSDAVDPNILALDMAGHSIATATVYTRTPDENGLKLYLAEVDANGVLVQGTREFAYNVAMSSDAPMLTLENDHETVAVTNQEKYEEPETESETEQSETEQSETEQSVMEQTETEQPTQQTETEDETSAKKQAETEPVKAAKTGDETNVRLYLILLALSAGIMAAVFARKYGKRKKG